MRRPAVPLGVRAVILVMAISAFATAAFVTPSSAVTEGRFGINRVNLAWLPVNEREKILELMTKNGIKSVRFSLSKPVDASIDVLRVAHEKGLEILLEIPLNNPAFFPAGTKPRTGHERIWDMYRLSDISAEMFRSEFGESLRKIERLGIPLVAVEIGNEINWGAYNGDLDVKFAAKTRTARSLGELNDRDALERGAAKYVLLLKAAREELLTTAQSAGAKVVSAGLSDIPLADADRRGIDSIDPRSFTELLRKHGLDGAADAYGIHIYPGGSGTPAAREQHITEALAICGSPPEGKPCWITEWGFANTAKSCPADDGPRERLARATRETFEELMKAGRVAAAYYFDWDAIPYGVWRCGELSATGRAVAIP